MSVTAPTISNPTTTTESAGNVLVTFYTTTFEKSMPEQAYSIPITTLPDGLTCLIQSVLQISQPKFDFLIHQEYLSTSIERFLRRRAISFEEMLNIEYTPALEAKEGTLVPHDEWVSCVRAPVLGNDKLLLTGCYDHCVRLWDEEECIALEGFHRECVKEIAVHPIRFVEHSDGGDAHSRKRKRNILADGLQFASCSKDGTIAGWRYSARESRFILLGSIHAHLDGVDTVHISPNNGKLIATASWDSTIKLFEWSQLEGEDSVPSRKVPIVTFTDHTRPVLCCRFSESSDGNKLFSAGLDGALRCHDMESAQLSASFSGDHPIQSISIRPGASGAKLILTACTDNRCRLFDTREKAVVKTFSGHRQWPYAVSWLWHNDEDDKHPNSFVTGSEDGTVRVWDLRSTTAPILTQDSLHTDGVLDVSYVGDSIIASCGKDNKTKTFTVEKSTD